MKEYVTATLNETPRGKIYASRYLKRDFSLFFFHSGTSGTITFIVVGVEIKHGHLHLEPTVK